MIPGRARFCWSSLRLAALHPALALSVAVRISSASASGAAEAPAGSVHFKHDIQPLLEEYCYDCHGDGMSKGGVAFDQFTSESEAADKKELWWNALKNLRAGIMPPAHKPQPTPEEKARIGQWIKSAVFEIDPANPDPGRVTVRRLNRVEYRNTIQDLMGVDYDTQNEFPPDDTGHGFDDIGDVLTLPVMLLEKYVNAAEAIVSKAVPLSPEAKNYSRFFSKPPPPVSDPAARETYARSVLGAFAARAYRRPVDGTTVDRLVKLAERTSSSRGARFETGIAQAMVAVLASPRFLFRIEGTEPDEGTARYPSLDEYSLASRLSYFLWSSMPDEELFVLSREHALRANLGAQVKRMLADPKSQRFIHNFTGQWLEVRDIDSISIDARTVLNKDGPPDPDLVQRRERFRQLRQKHENQLTPAERSELDQLRNQLFRNLPPPRVELTGPLRRDMREETESVFRYVLREDRSLLELIDADYTFLNERLADYYGIAGVQGDQIRRVTLPAWSDRGGVLTEGTVLIVTSNPTRTSPVKRGLFVLDNILGTPPPPPPPNIPALEDASKGIKDHTPTLREILALHRAKPLCASCHDRMDPLGLALENFNALGLWRDHDQAQPIDATGQLVTGETFANVKQLKHILVHKHAADFYRTLTEKLLTYALGRGLDYHDVETVDQIVDRLEKNGGRPSALLTGIIESAPFQKTRGFNSQATSQVHSPRRNAG